MGTSNECLFKFTEKSGFFNSPRYPANYPLDTNCTYLIKAEPGEQILLHFEQFALYEESSKNECNDWLEIYDIFYDKNGTRTGKLQGLFCWSLPAKKDVSAKHCWTIFPGPTISGFGSHEMRVTFFSNSYGTANGFNTQYIIRKAFEEAVPKTGNSFLSD